MLLEPRFAEEDVENEKGVIIEEIGMYEDSPEDTAVDRLNEACFKGSLGRPILGRRKTVSSFTSAGLRQFKEEHYTPDKIVVAVCGRFTEENIRRIAEKLSGIPAAAKP
jgi:predicted Zn-dependent peptidase